MPELAASGRSRPGISEVELLLDGLPAAEQATFRRIYEVSTASGHLRIPEAMREWVVQQFGSLEAVENQRIVRITNRWTFESAIFNPLRSQRPTPQGQASDSGAPTLEYGPFAHPEEMTPAESFGRLCGRFATTAGNVALYDGFHGLIIFDEPDSLRIDADAFLDALDLAGRWYQACNDVDEDAVYPLFTWNCGARAGASISHAHAQMTLGKRTHYGGALRLRDAARRYRDACGSAFFDDLFAAHESLGLGWSAGDVRGFASLTPVKERETWLLAPSFDERFGREVHRVISALVEHCGMAAFNLAIYPRPLGTARDDWAAFPVLARVVDRGSPGSATSDIAAMELFAASVVFADPFDVARTAKSEAG